MSHIRELLRQGNNASFILPLILAVVIDAGLIAILYYAR